MLIEENLELKTDHSYLLLNDILQNNTNSYIFSNNEDLTLFANLQDIITNLSKDELELVTYSILKKELVQNTKLDWIFQLIKSANKATNYDNSKPEIKVRLLNLYPDAVIEHFMPIKEALEEKHQIKITNDDDYDVVIDGVFGRLPINNPQAYKIFITGESIPAKLTGYDLSLGFDYINNDNYIRYPLYYIYYKALINTEYKREV